MEEGRWRAKQQWRRQGFEFGGGVEAAVVEEAAAVAVAGGGGSKTSVWYHWVPLELRE